MPLIETLNKIRREQDTIKEQIFQEFAQGLDMIDRAKQKEEERQLREREKLEETAITYENGKKITTKNNIEPIISLVIGCLIGFVSGYFIRQRISS